MNDKKDRKPMRCSADGAKLNHHATMIRDPVNREEADSVDPLVDGVLIEVHACPKCGRGQPRPTDAIS